MSRDPLECCGQYPSACRCGMVPWFALLFFRVFCFFSGHDLWEGKCLRCE